jgi:antitoxin Phd_YefM of type II toxin-antitoxin system
MKAWKTNEVKDHFAEILDDCYQEPQLVYEKNDPVAVIVNIRMFKELISQQHRKAYPSIRQLLDEIHSIIIDDSIEIEIPKRSDRSNSTEEVLDELSV